MQKPVKSLHLQWLLLFRSGIDNNNATAAHLLMVWSLPQITTVLDTTGFPEKTTAVEKKARSNESRGSKRALYLAGGAFTTNDGTW